MREHSFYHCSSQHPRRQLRTPLTALATVTLLALSQAAWSRGEITSIQTHTETATASSYVEDGVVYNWGAGDDLYIDGFTYNNRYYGYQMLADKVVVRRADNSYASGPGCSVFAQTEGSALTYSGSYPAMQAGAACDMATLISSNRLNVGALDVFANDDFRPRSAKNIERVDLIVSQGLMTGNSTAALDAAGHTIIEKHGNNPLQLAAILSLDSAGNPASYGPLVRVNPAWSDSDAISYGITAVAFPLDFMGTLEGARDHKLSFAESNYEPMGMAFVSQTDLGLSSGERYFGYSVFPDDVSAADHNLLDIDSYPKNTAVALTTDAGDADFFAAFAIPQDGSGNTAPVANDDSATTSENTAVVTDVLANDSDADGDALTVTVIEYPLHGTISADNGLIRYQPDNGFSGNDRIVYSVDDGNGGTDTAEVTINVTAVLGNSFDLDPIQTGLKGHGGGSTGLLGLISLIALGRMRRAFRS